MQIAQDASTQTEAARATNVGIVVIGRNEGERLRVALRSAARASERVVYVDSGSKDGSVALAQEAGIDVVELDGGVPFTAARGRNAGFARLRERWPDTRFVQFIDGDCELVPGWIGVALAAMEGAPRTAVIFGRRRERHPDQTVFNRVCDIEWEGPAGLAESCGGDSLMRVDAFLKVGGFADDLIAAEDNDICHRMRRLGWQIVRLPDEMTLHDVAMTTLGQWWRRNRRSGHAGAEAWHRRGAEDRRLVKPVLSNLLWGLPLFWPLWPLLWWRVYRRSGALYATHIVAGKLPHCAGQLGFWWSMYRARQMRLIEYK
jgi:GT2 family glycosyltransferase